MSTPHHFTAMVYSAPKTPDRRTYRATRRERARQGARRRKDRRATKQMHGIACVLLLTITRSAVALARTRAVLFQTNFDLRRASGALRDFPRAFSNWGVAEWKQFGLPPLRLSVQSAQPDGEDSAGGARIIYYEGDRGLEESGGIEFVAVQTARDLLQPWGSPGVIMRPLPGGGGKPHEDVMFAQLLRECNGGLLSQCGTPLPRPFLVNPATRSTLGRIAGACAYDKTVRKRY